MKKKTSVITIITVIVVGIILALIIQTNGFFVQFQNTTDVERFLTQNLDMNVSSIDDVEEFMQSRISRLESCNLSVLPESRNNNFDDNSLYCRVLSKNTSWVISLFTNYYTIRFYFDNGILQDVNVGTYFLGP